MPATRTASSPRDAPRVVESAGMTASDGSSVVHVQGLDQPRSTASSKRATSCLATARPRCSLAHTDSRFSPNGDYIADTATISGRLSEFGDWILRVRTGRALCSRDPARATPSALSGMARHRGVVVPEASYAVSVTAIDGWQNGPTTGRASLAVDLTPSQLAALTPGPGDRRLVRPERRRIEGHDRPDRDELRARQLHGPRPQQRQRPRPPLHGPERDRPDERRLGWQGLERRRRAGWVVRHPGLPGRRAMAMSGPGPSGR